MKRRVFLSRILSMFAASPAVALLPSAPPAAVDIGRTTTAAEYHWREMHASITVSAEDLDDLALDNMLDASHLHHPSWRSHAQRDLTQDEIKRLADSVIEWDRTRS